MKPEIAKLREEAQKAQSECDRTKGKLLEIIRNCCHNWSEPVSAHQYHAAYTIPGDPPGVGGSDHQFECYVPSKIVRRWKRTCTVCGKVEYTFKIRQEVIEYPQF